MAAQVGCVFALIAKQGPLMIKRSEHTQPHCGSCGIVAVETPPNNHLQRVIFPNKSNNLSKTALHNGDTGQ